MNKKAKRFTVLLAAAVTAVQPGIVTVAAAQETESAEAANTDPKAAYQAALAEYQKAQSALADAKAANTAAQSVLAGKTSALQKAQQAAATANTNNQQAAAAVSKSQAREATLSTELASAKKDAERKAGELAKAKQALENAKNNPNADYEAALARVEAAQAQYDKGSLGFFEERAQLGDEAEKEDAHNAIAIITDKDGSSQRISNPIIGPSTDPSKTYDAANLENMKQAIVLIELANGCRKIDDNFPGLADLEVSHELMAIAQVDVNYSDTYRDHAGVYGPAENLAWGVQDGEEDGTFKYGDPFVGWYDLEREIYEEGAAGPVGHYLNIVNVDYGITGFAVSKDPNTVGGICHGQTFGMGTGINLYTYYDNFMAYYNRVVGELDAAKAALAAIESQPNTGTGNSAAVAKLGEAVEKAQAAYDEATAAQAALEEQLDEQKMLLPMHSRLLTRRQQKPPKPIRLLQLHRTKRQLLNLMPPKKLLPYRLQVKMNRLPRLNLMLLNWHLIQLVLQVKNLDKVLSKKSMQ